MISSLTWDGYLSKKNKQSPNMPTMA
jgi:hypothetical protein